MSKPLREHLLSCMVDPLRQSCHSFLRYIDFIYLDSLTVFKNRGGNVPSHLVAGFLQYSRYVGQNGTLAVGSCYMDKLQIILRISETAQQLRHRIQAQDIAVF